MSAPIKHDPDSINNSLMIDASSIETEPELELEVDEKRIIRAQQLLNDVHKLYEELNRDAPDEDQLRDIQTTLSETGMLLTLAGYEKVDDIAKCIGRIEQYFLAKKEERDEVSMFKAREGAYMSISSVTLVDPMKEL